MNEIKKARSTIREAFEKDPNFEFGYVANISCLIHDNLDFKREFAIALLQDRDGLEWEVSNGLAKKIVKLVFG